MSGINKAILVGNLGADPEVRYTQSNQAVANLRIATNEAWTDREGKRQERVEWHRVIAFGRLAEVCQGHLAKGRQVYVEGRIQTREWEDKDGQKRFTTEIVAQTVQFLGSAPSSGGAGAGRGSRESDGYGGRSDGYGRSGGSGGGGRNATGHEAAQDDGGFGGEGW